MSPITTTRSALKGFYQRLMGHEPGAELEALGYICDRIEAEGRSLRHESEEGLRRRGAQLRQRRQRGEKEEDLLVEVFALVRQVADRVLGLRPFTEQLMAGIALHQGKVVEMQTGEGKTLAAVLPACLNALAGQGVHILTFNDYLARRDRDWMGPVYEFVGLSVAAIQEGMGTAERQAAYSADITYATAKEAGFDFLRAHLARDPDQVVQRHFNFALVDEADSILIDEARVPLVIAGQRPTSQTDPYRLAELVGQLEGETHWELGENQRNVFLTEAGLDRLEEQLECGDLHQDSNYLLLTEVNQALHARALFRRDVDYIVRHNRIELVDEFTGRVVDDRRWPDGLQAALEAKEGLAIQPGGQILGSIALQHFLKQYSKLAGMTATALDAADELAGFYQLQVVAIPPHRRCGRRDLADIIFTHKAAKFEALVGEITRAHQLGRPVLVGTSSVEESESLAAALAEGGVDCQVLNAKNDAEEAQIIAWAGVEGAVTISTNMAGRGTDIRLGGLDGVGREQVVELGGLYVIGTNRHESRRIDAQLRGRAGRQGDPGSSRFFISLEDDLMVRFALDDLIPPKYFPAQSTDPIDHPVIRREVDRLQRIVEGQNYEIRKTLWRYTALVEEQRHQVQQRRQAILLGREVPALCANGAAKHWQDLCRQVGETAVAEAEKKITLDHYDLSWSEYLAYVAQVREGIHLVGMGGLDPLDEFAKQVGEAFAQMQRELEGRILDSFKKIQTSPSGLDLERAGLTGPSSTWTYLINDRGLSEIQQTLLGRGNIGFSAGAALTAGPLLAAWGLWQRWGKKKN